MRSHNRGFTITRSKPNRINQGGVASAIYNNAALAAFYTARGNRESAPCDILFVGDSITEGFNTSYGNRWQDIAIKNLRTAYPTTGVTEIGGANYVPVVYSFSPNAWTGTQPYNAAADVGTINAGANGLFSGHVISLASVGASRTWNFENRTFDKVDMFYNGWTGQFGQFKIQIDGGTTEGTNQFTLTANGSPSMQKWSSPTLFAGSHTITVTAITLGASSVSVPICGFMLYRGDGAKGIRSIDCGRQTWKVSDFNTQNAFDACAQMPNVKLIVMALTTNDYRAQTALATWETAITTALSTIRTKTGNTNCPCLFVPYTEAGDLASQPITWAQYVARLSTICDTAANYCGLLDLGTRGLPTAAKSPTTPVDALGVWDTDRLHPTTTGHAFIGPLVSSQLGL